MNAVAPRSHAVARMALAAAGVAGARTPVSRDAPPIDPASVGLDDVARWRQRRPGGVVLSPVLVVEDDRRYAALLHLVLGHHGIRADVAMTGEDAVFCAKRRRYAAILLDLRLPDVHGLDLAKDLRRLPGGRGARIVALTGVPAAEARPEAMHHGIDDYRTKPIRALDLVDALSTSVR